MLQVARDAGVLGRLDCPLGLGLLRLSTEGRPPLDDAVALIHLALNGGIRLLDTADVYGLDANDLHYGEALVRQALQRWEGPSETVRVLTKAGLTRRGTRWLPRGRPQHLRSSVEQSLNSLGVERLFMLLLHARDPHCPFEETLAELAALQQQGLVEHLGLCNVSVAEVQQAQRHFVVAAVQSELSVLHRKPATSGLLHWTLDQGIPFLAHRPLGGYAKVHRLAKSTVLKPLAERHRATSHEIALAALRDAAPHVVPLIGATRAESVVSSVRSLGIRLDVSDHTALSIRHAFQPHQDALQYADVPAPGAAASLQPGQGPGDQPEVVVLMGIQGAGKSRLVEGYLHSGYARLNRDQLGGTLEDLVPRLEHLLRGGQQRVVLDNTYPTRLSRRSVIAASHAHGVAVRCRHLATPLREAQKNVVLRMIAKYGVPLGPEEMKRLSKQDPNLPPPAAMFRWAASFEPPQLDEGFADVEQIPFARDAEPAHTAKGLLLDVDGTLRKTLSGELYPRTAEDVEILPGRRETLAQWVEAGYQLFFVSNQSGVASGRVSLAAMQQAFLRTAQLLGVPIVEVAYCPHPAHPVGCYCRKPMPGLGVYLMQRHRLAAEHLVVVGDMDSDAELAAGLGATYYDAADFFGLNGPRPHNES